MANEYDMRQDIESVLFTEEQIAEIVQRIGQEISRDYAGKNLLLVSVLKGSVVFMADLMRAITIPARIDFMATSSYGAGVKTSGVVKILKDLDLELAGYDIAVRGGLQCAPLMHQHLCTFRQGVVRASVSCVTTRQECFALLNAVDNLSQKLARQ